MNLKKLTTLLFAGVTAATPLVTNAQNPTILQGNYVSNVFGQANFVLNPNAQTNVANVTLSNATATRSTTTPLVATSEWNVTVTSANGTITWATRSFDAGMKNQNCEARFTYRGFQATSKAQIKQGANVVAELTLTPSATDPRIASINFPCGDLSAANTFVITDSATLSGTNEIGGIYVGLATNQANVAQAEVVVRAELNATQVLNNNTETTIVYATEDLDVYGEYDTSTGIFTAKRPGQYMVTASLLTQSYTWTAGRINMILLKNLTTGETFASDRFVTDATVSKEVNNNVTGTLQLNVGDQIVARYYHTQGTNINSWNSNNYNRLTISRFPLSSELVVTPETQNVWGASTYAGTTFGPSYFSGTVAPTSYTTISDPGFTSRRTLKGKCKAPISGDDVGCRIENMPVGNYKVSFSGLMYEKNPVVGGRTVCNYEIYETTLSNTIASRTSAEMRTVSNDQIYRSTSMDGVFTNSSIANRNFVIRTKKGADINTGDVGTCSLFVGDAASTDHTTIEFVIEPLDNASNSALYVQGPVKAAATGAAIPAGYQGEYTLGSVIAGNYTNNTWMNISSVNLTAGIWKVETNCNMRNQSTTGWNFAAISISNNSVNQGTDINTFSYVYQQPSGTTNSQYDHQQASGIYNVTSTMTRYINIYSGWVSGGAPTYVCQTRTIRLN